MLESGYKTKLKKRKTKFNHTHVGKNFKSTFLLALAYAMTRHKAQRATVAAKVIIDTHEAFTPGLTYVLLSRVTESKYVMLPRKLIVDDFKLVKHKILNDKE